MPIKDWALAYARIGWPVFPITGYKTPFKNSHGHLDATTDPTRITEWWTARPGANLATALGEIVVVDVDGPSAIAHFKAICHAHGGLPRTATALTSKGFHFYFRCPPGAHIRSRNEPRAKAGDDGIDIKAHGGWVVLPPSVNAKNKFVYKWISPLPTAELPEWLLPALNPNERGRELATIGFGPLPAHLANNQSRQIDVTRILDENLKSEWSPSEQARLESALRAIPITCGYDAFLQIGMALKGLDWDRPDGTSIGFDIWNRWCAQADQHNEAGLEYKWTSFKRSGVSVGTLYHLAQQHGWTGIPEIVSAPAPQPGSVDNMAAEPHAGGTNGHAAGPAALPAAFGGMQPIFFPDRTEDGKTKPTMLNAKVAIKGLGLDCRYDMFHNRMLVAGEVIGQWASTEVSDHVLTIVRDHIRLRFGFDPKKENVQDACEALCLQLRFDPVLDYLASLKWDGRPRLDRWMVTYLGAADTELNHAIGRLSLIAAVRRVRRPGTKFDQIIVLEGPQGQGKSEAIEILAGAANFSDQTILGVDDRKQQELTEGVWLYEIGELSGMRKAEIEHVKAFASRKVDRARPAYGRYMVSQPRRTVFFASTNAENEGYLQDASGNRRFWPAKVTQIDLNALRADRDQLWAEAQQREAAGESHMLPAALWKAAGAEQERRLARDTWLEGIERYVNMEGKERSDVSILEVLVDNQFIQRRPDQVTRGDEIRAGNVLRQLGFTRYHKRIGPTFGWRYRRES